VGAAAIWTGRVQRVAQADETRSDAGSPSVEDALRVEPISVDVGMGLLSLAREGEGGVMAPLRQVRHRVAQELGLVMPSVRVRDDASLHPLAYCIRLRDAVVGAGTLHLDRVLAVEPSGGVPTMPGEPATEGAFGLPAVWLRPQERAMAESRGMTVMDPAAALASHLLEVVRRRGWELLSVEETARQLDRLRQRAPRAADLVQGPEWPLSRLRDLLRDLLREGLSIRDMERIAEAVHGSDPRDPADALRKARRVAAGDLCERLLGQGEAGQRTLDAVWVGAEAMQRTDVMRAAERSVVPDAALAEAVVRQVAPGLRRLLDRGSPAVVVTPDPMREMVSSAVRGRLGDVTVLARGEIPPDCRVRFEGLEAHEMA
jgi:flagellar biosynthesis protein FlhA